MAEDEGVGAKARRPRHLFCAAPSRALLALRVPEQRHLRCQPSARWSSSATLKAAASAAASAGCHVDRPRRRPLGLKLVLACPSTVRPGREASHGASLRRLVGSSIASCGPRLRVLAMQMSFLAIEAAARPGSAARSRPFPAQQRRNCAPCGDDFLVPPDGMRPASRCLCGRHTAQLCEMLHVRRWRLRAPHAMARQRRRGGADDTAPWRCTSAVAALPRASAAVETAVRPARCLLQLALAGSGLGRARARRSGLATSSSSQSARVAFSALRASACRCSARRRRLLTASRTPASCCLLRASWALAEWQSRRRCDHPLRLLLRRCICDEPAASCRRAKDAGSAAAQRAVHGWRHAAADAAGPRAQRCLERRLKAVSSRAPRLRLHLGTDAARSLQRVCGRCCSTPRHQLAAGRDASALRHAERRGVAAQHDVAVAAGTPSRWPGCSSLRRPPSLVARHASRASPSRRRPCSALHANVAA
jgi:hypothetical protein